MVHFFLNNDDNHSKVYGATFQKYWRLFLIILNLIIQLRQQINSCIARDFSVTCLARNKFLTVQANYMIIIWLVLWFLWRENKEKIDKLYGKLYGSFIVYITLVWLAYWVLLSSGDSYSGFDGITNIVQHYFTPIVMIIDWLYTEKKRYEWNYYYIWSIYPTLYDFCTIKWVSWFGIWLLIWFFRSKQSRRVVDDMVICSRCLHILYNISFFIYWH